ncbi:hypothetical protein RJ640_010182 [Escallonia rubra]|uniref:Uncharacterized protein n=1 Tax=Escallonia rubra TaxID=112253 RepID=A0AA88UJL1_9ASTE|nr:hypothetical protein RJ640_010182 [Escallonia rubra]
MAETELWIHARFYQAFQYSVGSFPAVSKPPTPHKQETTMVLNLQCSCSYEKIKKILCDFPREIKDQVYDEKNNTVTIKVVCCSPENFRDELCRRGGKTIKSIEIVKPQPQHRPHPDATSTAAAAAVAAATAAAAASAAFASAAV